MMRSKCGEAIMLLLILLNPLTVCADQGGLGPSFSIESPDRKYIFVVLRRPYPSQVTYYPASGIYLNDGSRTPLWAVGWDDSVTLPCDGEHVIRRGGWAWASGTYDEEALSFFARDQLLRTYRVKDLVDFPYLLPHSVSHYNWQSYENAKNQTIRLVDIGEVVNLRDVEVDCDANTLRIVTLHGDSYTFDVTTGEIISDYRPVRYTSRSSAILIGVIYIIYLWLARKKAPNAWRNTLIRVSIFAGCVAFIMIVAGIVLDLSRTPNPDNMTASFVAKEALWRLVFVLPHDTVRRFGLFSDAPYTFRYFASSLLFWTILALGVGMLNAFVELWFKRLTLHFLH